MYIHSCRLAKRRSASTTLLEKVEHTNFRGSGWSVGHDPKSSSKRQQYTLYIQCTHISTCVHVCTIVKSNLYILPYKISILQCMTSTCTCTCT